MAPIIRYVHVLGAALLLTGALAGGVVTRHARQARSEGRELDAAAHELLRLANAGLLLLLLSGIGAIYQLGFSVALHRGSVHVMLLAWIVTGALNGVAGARARRLASGKSSIDARGTVIALVMAEVFTILAAMFAGIWAF